MQLNEEQLQALEQYVRRNCSDGTTGEFLEDFINLVNSGSLGKFLNEELEIEGVEVPVERLAKLQAMRFDKMDGLAIDNLVQKFLAAFT